MGLVDRLSVLVDLVVPSWCAGCDVPGPRLCEACRSRIAAVREPVCARCGHPWAVPTATCAECPPAIGRLSFAAAYRDPLPAVMSAFKDGHRPRLAAELAALVLERCGSPPPGVALVPVPSTPSHRRERGFDPAAEVAALLGAAWERPVLALLRRPRNDPPQRGLSATDRARNVRGAFELVRHRTPPPAVCLIDDVCTTGATLAACARTLRAGGARQVNAVAVGRVLATP